MNSKSSNKINVNNYEWLVANRSEIQKFILLLYKFQLKTGKKIKNDSIKQDVYYLLVGIAFCLWRAVFLSDLEKEWEAKFENAQKLLIKLIEDNAISFYDEKKLNSWVFRYYLNNAYFRIKLILDESGIKKHITNVEEIKVINNFYKSHSTLLCLGRKHLKEGNHKEAWSRAYLASYILFRQLERM